MPDKRRQTPTNADTILVGLLLALLTISTLAASKTSGRWQQQVARQDPPLSTTISAEHSAFTADEAEDTPELFPVAEPFIVRAANVGDPVSAELQAQLEAEVTRSEGTSGATGAFRALLHGTKKPEKYPVCVRCRMVRCSKGFCTGHCRKNRQLHKCSSNNVASPEPEREDPDHDGGCGRQPTLQEVQSLPSDAIEEYDTVVVTAEAPYIGCADIANRPNGCPARGTRATLPGGRQVSVMTSVCRTEHYVPDCGSPLLPFGACECFYRDAYVAVPGVRGPPLRTVRAACSTAELVAGYGVGGADGSPSEGGITVQPRGATTETLYSDFRDPGQQPAFFYAVNASVRSIDVELELEIYPAVVVSSAEVQAQSDYDVSEDYDYD